MSYILEALKKAERERGMSRVPTLASVHDFHGIQRTRPILIALGLMVCAAGLMWFLRSTPTTVTLPPAPSPVGPAQNEPKSPRAAEPVADSRTILDVPPAETKMSARTGEVTALSMPVPPRPATSNASQPAVEIHRDSAIQATPESARGVSAPNRGAVVSQPVAPAEASTSSQTKPASLREAMAKLTISLLVYADAEADRKVYINGKKYVKGDLVEGRYLIESITQEGAVLSYEGDRALLRP